MAKKTKHQMVSELLKRFGAMKHEDITALYKGIVNEETKELTEDAVAIDVPVEVSKLFEGSEISEDLKAKTVAIFEVAIADKVSDKVKSLEENIGSAIDALVVDITEEQIANTDKYLTYVVEDWVKENELQVNNSIKLDIAENFISGLKGLFAEHNVNLDEQNIELVSKLNDKVSALEKSLNEEISEKIDLQKVIAESEIKKIFNEATSDLADTQVERLAGLMEGLEFTSPDVYQAKLEIVKESYFPSNSNKVAELTEDDTGEKDNVDGEEKDVRDDSQISPYISYLSANATAI